MIELIADLTKLSFVVGSVIIILYGLNEFVGRLKRKNKK